MIRPLASTGVSNPIEFRSMTANTQALAAPSQILAFGGGGFQLEDENSPIDDYILQITGKSKPRICLVSVTSGDLPEYIEKFYAAFSTRSCEPSAHGIRPRPASGTATGLAIPKHCGLRSATSSDSAVTKFSLRRGSVLKFPWKLRSV